MLTVFVRLEPGALKILGQILLRHLELLKVKITSGFISFLIACFVCVIICTYAVC